MKERPEDFLARYGISPTHGFLPDVRPLVRLSDPYYAPWEALLDELPDLISRRHIRSKISDLATLETEYLQSEEEWHRAYLILGFLTHAYIWGGDHPFEHVPPQLTRPFLTTSGHLGLPPVMTYATMILWNFATKAPGADLTEPNNLASLHTMTGTDDEEWFYNISTSVEARGGSLMVDMLHCIRAVWEEDDAVVLSCLRSTLAGIQDVTALLSRMHERCDPQIFFHNIRPMLAGSKGMGGIGLPRGILYDEGGGRGVWREYSGGSNAQSSLIQLFDIFLGVEHHATGDKERSPSGGPRGTNAFILEMRKYMPSGHREFLAQMTQISNIRDYVYRPNTSSTIRQAYNDAVDSLVALRNTHIQIVARYIIAPSRCPPAEYVLKSPGLSLATSTTSLQRPNRVKVGAMEGLHGTGGTELLPFLKKTRDETRLASWTVTGRTESDTGERRGSRGTVN